MQYDFDKIVGERIHEYRIKNSLTQNVLAARLQLLGLDISRNCIAKIEVGKRHIYLVELKYICIVLKISFDKLLE